MYKLPEYITRHRLAELPQAYAWEVPYHHNFFFSAVTDETDQMLANQLLLMNDKAVFFLGIACAEWIAARFEGLANTKDLLYRIEMLWATNGPGTTKLPEEIPSPEQPKKLHGPVYTAAKCLTLGNNDPRNGEYTFACTMGLALLADHVMGNHEAYRSWFRAMLKKCQDIYPKGSEERRVPPEFFNPED